MNLIYFLADAADTSHTAEGGALLGMSLLGIIYMVPSFLSVIRRHHNRGAIIATNLLLGWTILGWAIALIWSMTHVQEDR